MLDTPERSRKLAEHAAACDNMSKLIEPIMISVLGGLVGTLVIAMYLPIFKMGSIM